MVKFKNFISFVCLHNRLLDRDIAEDEEAALDAEDEDALLKAFKVYSII